MAECVVSVAGDKAWWDGKMVEIERFDGRKYKINPVYLPPEDVARTLFVKKLIRWYEGLNAS